MEDPRPFILIFPENSWKEIIPEKTLICSNPLYRWAEREMLQKSYHAEHFRDDTVIEPLLRLPRVIDYRMDWNIGICKTNSK